MLLFSNGSHLPVKLSEKEKNAAFIRLVDSQWRACVDSTATYTPDSIQMVQDVNGDGMPETVITEGSTYCYGNTGLAYNHVSKQANGRWKFFTNGTGTLFFWATRSKDVWTDIGLGGPGFCFPVMRWNGREGYEAIYQSPCRLTVCSNWIRSLTV